MAEPLTVSIVIPCRNAAATLERCLSALAEQRVAPAEIIVVDNGSTDDTAAIVQRWIAEASLPLRLIEVARTGAAAARNAAVQQATSDWIAFTDADCEPEPGWLATGLARLAEDEAGIAALAGPAWGTLEGDAAARLLGLTSLSVGLNEHTRRDAGPTGTQGFAAANLWVRRQALLDVGGFDESLATAGEDMDLCARIYAAGGTLRYLPALRVRHIHPSGTANMWRKQVQYGRAHAELLHRHGRPGIHLELPLVGLRSIPCRCRVWCNLASAEKKLLLLCLLAFWQPWLWLMLPPYLGWMGYSLAGRAAGLGVSCSAGEALWLAVLLIVKSAAMTWGRLAGSCKGAITC